MLGLRTERIDFEATPEAVWVTAEDAPAGRWERHWHNPRPVTPLYADFEFGSHLALSEMIALEEFRAIEAVGAATRPRRLYLVIDGFAYRGEPAPGYEWGWLEPAFQESVATHERSVEDYEWQVVRHWQEVTRPDIVSSLRTFRAVDLKRLAATDLRAHIRALSRYLVEIWATYFTVDAAAAVVRARAQAFFSEHLATTDAEFVQLFSGSSHATSEPLMRMEELARAIVANPTLFGDPGDGQASTAVRAALAVYLEAFGHRATEWEYIGATLAERPERALELLREAVGRVKADQPVPAEVASRGRDATVTQLRKRLPNAFLRQRFDRLLNDAKETFAIHEENVNFYMLASGYMRYALLAAGARLVRWGVIADRAQIFFIRRSELESALLGEAPDDLRSLVSARVSDYERRLHLDPPQTLEVAADGVLRSTKRNQTEQNVSVLRGLGASPGLYRGRARVIVGEDQFEDVQAGEVLVCPQTSPTWTILFGRIGALVTDDGGILSHPAIAAREFGLPAVVATGTATRVLATGQLIEVDGDGGNVRVLGH
jgi:pyruvate,water dikinase